MVRTDRNRLHPLESKMSDHVLSPIHESDHTIYQPSDEDYSVCIKAT
jgi:hypothetical protein